jgi:spermidine dehydrogenase
MTITRRDFLNGVAITVAAGLTPAGQGFAAEPAYPPAQLGLRGAHEGAFEIAHKLAREGEKFPIDKLAIEERYDLVIVGGGIAGLSAAYFYRKDKPKASILILDNHDDFGGHAKRNEFTIDGQLRLGYGGSESFQSPRSLWGEAAKGLIAELGIDLATFESDKTFHRALYPDLGLSRALFFDRASFGVDKLVTGDPIAGVADDIPADRRNGRTPAAFVGDFPVSEASRKQIIALLTNTKSVLPGKSKDEIEAYLDKTSYRDFLKEKHGLSPEALNCFQGRSHDFFAVGIDAIPASWAAETGYPGFDGLGLEKSGTAAAELDEAYVHHFPDGNAGLARLLVKALVPGVAAGAPNMQENQLARFDYSKLDVAGQPVRIRLSSTVVSAANAGDGVDIGYVTGGVTHRIAAGAAIMAGNINLIPYVIPSLQQAQRDAMAEGVRSPLVYTNVLIRNWQSFAKLGTHSILAPMSFFALTKLDYPVSLGGYAFNRSPDQPMVLHMVHVPVEANQGLSSRDQARVGRSKLYEMTFADFEKQIRGQLTAMLSPGGFSAERDIAAITVNRWPHGYAYAPNPLADDEDAFALKQAAAKKPFGRIAFGSSDTAWDAYAHAAIAEAKRAVGEVVGA